MIMIGPPGYRRICGGAPATTLNWTLNPDFIHLVITMREISRDETIPPGSLLFCYETLSFLPRPLHALPAVATKLVQGDAGI